MKYEKPIIEIVALKRLDIITMSLGEDGGNETIDPNSYDPDNY